MTPARVNHSKPSVMKTVSFNNELAAVILFVALFFVSFAVLAS